MQIASRYVTVDDVRTHYLEAGEGPPVVLLHSGEFGAAAEFSWEFTIPALARRHRVIAPDWLGYGRTDKIFDFGQGLARKVRHMRRFVETLCIENAHFAGNSMGGTLLVQAVAADPGAFPVRSLTLISSGGFVPDNEHRRSLLTFDGTADGIRAILRASMEDQKWANDDIYVARRVAMSLLPGAWECIEAARLKNPQAAAVRGIIGREDTTPYHNITVPVLIIAGALDKLRLPGYADEIARKIPKAEVHVLQDAGHCPNIERADIVNDLMLKFFAGL